jgi:AcrR family transcriptional regulator
MAKDKRTRILDAALDEFAAHGFAGARINRITSAAGANKQLIYYYFKSKEGLYENVLKRVYGELIEADKAVPKDLEHDLLFWMDFHNAHPYLIRLMEWDGLTRSRNGKVAHMPRNMWGPPMQRFESKRGVSGWPRGFHRSQTLIAALALETWPIAFPEVCRQITGMDPHDPRFIRDRRKFIAAFVRSLSSKRSKP